MRNRSAKKYSQILSALILVFFISGCGHNYTVEEHISRANAFMLKGNYKAASIELANAVTKNPKSMEARWMRAKAIRELGDFAGAEKEARKAVALDAPKNEVQPFLVATILQQGDLDRVLKETDTLPGMPTAEEKATLLGLRGQALVLKGQFEEAKQVLNEALKVEPDSAIALVGMAAMHGYQKEYTEAQRWIALAVKSAPKSPDVWSAKGDLDLAQDNLAAADEAFSKAIEFRHYLALDSAKRAFVRVLAGKLDAAKQDIVEIRGQGYSNHPYVNYVAGRLYFSQKQYNKAAESFESSLAVEPNSILGRLFLASSYYLTGQMEKALANAQQVLLAVPNSLRIQKLISAIYLNQLDYPSASATLNKALALAPNDVDVLNMLTDLSMSQGSNAKGLQYATKAVALAPQSTFTRNQLMVSRLLAGQSLNEEQLSSKHESNDAYRVQLLLALEAVRDKHLNIALDKARKLQAAYPNTIEPGNLVAAIYMLAGQWNKAKPELENVLKRQANDPSATRALATIEANTGNPKRAQDILLSYLKNTPTDQLAVLQLADIATRLGNVAIAMPFLEQTLQSTPNSLAVRARLASEYLNKRQLQNVLTLTQGISEEKLTSMPSLLELRGKALMLTGDTLTAQKTFERWKQIAPNSAAAYFYHGESLARAGNISEARKEVEHALKLNSRYLPARIAEIKVLVQARQLDKAQQALDKLKQDFPNRPETLGIAGWHYLVTGKFAEAERALSSVFNMTPNSEVAILLARAQWAQKEYDKSIKGMQSWLGKYPKDLDMLLHLAGAYLSQSNNNEARTVYAKIVEYYPGHVASLNNLAWLTQDSDLNLAIKYAQDAHTLAAKDPYVKDTLAMLLLKRGESANAERLLQEAFHLAPREPLIQLHLGQVLLRQQRIPQARKLLDDLIAKGTSQAKEARTLLDSLGSKAR
ncbi:MAG: PEP-CTERM system TPR-repeat protein PrsT [Gallionellaceae bacterium]|nr:PEP-CTERM system TPR-repeat protein PrsT [Gallionellaceae bacterium]